MEIGMAPFKSLLQTGFMMWMSGNSINIFSIMITGMIVMNTVKSLFNMPNGASLLRSLALPLALLLVTDGCSSRVGGVPRQRSRPCRTA
jgi:hypothetical protein